MAKKNNHVEKIIVEYQSNYSKALSELRQVRSSVEDNATAVNELEQAEYRLSAAMQKLEEVQKQVKSGTDDSTKSQADLDRAIKQVNASFDRAAKALESYKDLTTNATDSTDNATNATDSLADAQERLKEKTDKNNEAWKLADQLTGGLSSKFKDLIDHVKLSTKATDVDTAATGKLTTAKRVATVATRTLGRAIKGLLTASGIGIVLVIVAEIAEHWDSIVGAARQYLSESHKILAVEEKRLEATKTQHEKIMNSTEQLKLQGFTELEILKIKQNQTKELISGLTRANQLRREAHAEEFRFWEWLGLKKKEVWEDTEDYNNFKKELDNAKEAFAGFSNQITDHEKSLKKAANATKQNTKATNDNKAALERLNKVREEADIIIRDYTLNLSKLLNEGELLATKQTDWAIRENQINDARKEALDRINEAYKEGTQAYEDKTININKFHDLELANLKEEERLYKQNNLLLYETQANLENGNKSASERLQIIQDFLENITDTDQAENFKKILGVDAVQELSALMANFGDEFSSFEIDPMKSKKDNQSDLDAAREKNTKLLEIERDFYVKKAEDLEASEAEIKRIKDKYSSEIEQIEKDHNDASKELNKIKSDQIVNFASDAVDGLSTLAEGMGASFQTQKAFSMASSAINTYEGITTNLNAYPQPLGGIMAGITAAAGFMSLMNIAQTEPGNVNAGSVSAVSASLDASASAQPNVQYMQSSQSQLMSTINDVQNQDSVIKTYVTVGDINSAQELERNRRQNSSL